MKSLGYLPLYLICGEKINRLLCFCQFHYVAEKSDPLLKAYEWNSYSRFPVIKKLAATNRTNSTNMIVSRYLVPRLPLEANDYDDL